MFAPKIQKSATKPTKSAGPSRTRLPFTKMALEPEPAMAEMPWSQPVAIPGFVRAKLQVGDSNDPLEREADTIAERVMRVGPLGPSNSVTGRAQEPDARRKCSSCEHQDPEETVRREPAAGQRGGLASERFAGQVSDQMRHGSHSLPNHAQNFLESRLDAPLDGVRVHANTSAALLARQINAQAFTLDQDIFFAQGKFRPNTDSGMRLLAHEVTHTLQNRESDVVQKARRSIDDFDPETCEYDVIDVARRWYTNEKIGEIRHSSPGESPLLRSGSRGAAVEVLQQALRMWSCEAGLDEFAGLATDGVFGLQTYAAVREFQFAHTLQPDGVVGPHTVALLDFETNSPVKGEGASQMSNRPAQAHDCEAWVAPATQNANARVHRARLKLAALSGLDDEKVGGDPTIVQPLFERFFGALTPGRVDTMMGTLATMDRVLTEMVASLGPTQNASDWRVLCKPDNYDACIDGTPAQTLPGTKTIEICEHNMPSEAAHKESVIIHEAVHGALGADVDVYANLRLFDFLSGQLDRQGGTSAMHNPDSVAGFVMMLDGFGESDALKDRKPADDDYNVDNAEDLGQAKHALAFAESWVFEGEDELERFASSIRDGYFNWTEWGQYNGRTQLLLSTTSGLVDMKRAVLDEKFCNDTRSSPRRFPGLSCPSNTETPRRVDMDNAFDVRDVVRKLSEVFVKQKVNVFAVDQGNPVVRWIPGRNPPALLLRQEFFGENALRVQVVEIIKALAIELGSQPDYATNVAFFLGDHFYRIYGRSLATV